MGVRPKKEKKNYSSTKNNVDRFCRFWVGVPLFHYDDDSEYSEVSGKCVLFSPFLPQYVVSFFPPQEPPPPPPPPKKKKEKPRRPIVQERHNTAAPREEEEEEEKEEAGSERRRDARDTPPERATLLGEDDDDDDDDFFETFVGEKKGNGKVEVLLLLRFLSKGFSSDIFLVGRRRGPRGETRRSLFLSKKKKKKKKKSRIFCPFARRLGKARCSFDRVSFLRRPKLPRAP